VAWRTEDDPNSEWVLTNAGRGWCRSLELVIGDCDDCPDCTPGEYAELTEAEKDALVR
jgi:hypothetical protein